MGANAIHVWHLETRGANRTLVNTNESMNGIMLKVLYSSKELEESQHAWLKALKRVSEK